jgi:hypothetical protein
VGAQPSRSRLDGFIEKLVVSIVLATGLVRSSGGPQWRGDMTAVRDLQLVVIDVGGAVTTELTQAIGLLPLGSLSFRAAMVSVCALGMASWCLFRIARRVLEQAKTPARLASVLSGIAALSPALSPTWQLEATVGGGALVAVALVLAGTWLVLEVGDRHQAALTPRASHRWLAIAALIGATFAESLPAGFALLVVVAAVAATATRPPPLALRWPLFGVATLSGLFLIVPRWLRPLAPRSWADVGRALSSADLQSLDVAATRSLALHAWFDELGIISLGMAGLGLALGLLRERLRVWVAPIVALGLLDLLYPLSGASGLSADPLVALRCLTLSMFSVAAALGIAAIVRFLYHLDVPMARPAASLVVVFHLSVAAVACEEAGFVADRSEHDAARAWTDDALGALAPRAAVLVHSPALAWRLWCAQSIAGERPDVLVVPVPLLHHGEVTANLLPSEPRVALLLRDYALTGRASEYGLSALADERPLLVELDETWDKRLVGHLKVEGPWLRFVSEVIGRSERENGAPHIYTRPGNRVLRGMNDVMSRDASSVAIVLKTLKEHAAALSLFGGFDAAQPLLDGIEQLAPHDAFLIGARVRLASATLRKTRHGVELRDLLRY